MSSDSYIARQRTALRILAALVKERAEAETAVARERKQRTDRTEQAFAAATREIQKRFETETAAALRELEETLKRVEAQFEADQKLALERVGVRREALLAKAQHNEQSAQKGLEEAVWLAETIFEAGENKPQEQYEAMRRLLGAHADRAQAVREEAERYLRRCRMRLPSSTPPDSGAGAGQGDSAEALQHMTQEAEQQLQRLFRLRAPRLFQGVLPVVPVLVLAAAGAAAAMAMHDWQIVPPVFGFAAGGAALGAILMTLLYVVARSRCGKIASGILSAAAGARIAFDQCMAKAADQRDRHMQSLVQTRDKDIETARTKFAPIPGHVKQRRDQHLAELEGKHATLIADVGRAHEDGIRQAKERHAARTAEASTRRDADSSAAQRRHDEDTAASVAWYAKAWNDLEQRWKRGRDETQSVFSDVIGVSDRLFRPWNDPSWTNWTPPQAFAPIIRFGSMDMDIARLSGGVPTDPRLATPHPARFNLPALLEFPDRCSLLVEAGEEGRDRAVALLQTIMLRLLTTLPPGKVRFTIIDPVGLGQNFAGFMHLADYEPLIVGEKIWTETRHLEQRLTDLTEHMENVIQKYLRNEFQTIGQYNEQAGEIAEPYRFVVVANFPANFSEAAARRLMSVAESGPRCGVYTLVTADVRQPLPQGIELSDLRRHSTSLTIGAASKIEWQDEDFEPLPLALDPPPDDEFLTKTLRAVGQGSRDSTRVQVPFEVVAPPDGQLWTADCSTELRVPLGRAGATKLQHLSLGTGTAHHALIAGKTGSGKSTLLHVLITNLSLWYSPEQVEFYLVDFKKGVEFKTYAVHELPHARAVAIESDREFGLSVLQRLDHELKHRGNRFRDLGVQDIAAFRRACSDPMPRTLLIVDEFQEFFVEDDKIGQDAALLLDRLVRQGRAFGIHVLLGSQTLGGAYSLARSTIGQMAVRIALQCSEADSYLILSEDNSAARLLSRPGEAIYNDASGIVEGNSPFQIVWLPDEQREQQLQRAERAAVERKYLPPEPRIVFEGNVPAEIQNNHRLADLLAAPKWPAISGGAKAWLGEPIEIKDPTAAVFRRQSGHNLLLVGQREESAKALLASSLISLAAQFPPDQVRLILMDATPPEAPDAEELARVAKSLPHQVQIVGWRDVPTVFGELNELVDRRHQATAPEPMEVFILIYGLQRYRPLRQEDEFTFSASEESAASAAAQFMNVLREGPVAGVHTIAWCDTAGNVNRMLGRQGLREFETRVLFQMSANDSSVLIDSPVAGRLGLKRALLSSEEHGLLEKFRPYSMPEDEWLKHASERLAARLSGDGSRRTRA